MRLPITRTLASLVVLALLGTGSEASAQPTSSSAELHAFLYANVLTMEPTGEVLRAQEAAHRAQHEQYIELLRTNGDWDDLTEDQRADLLAGSSFEPLRQLVELIPGIGIIIMDDSEEFSMPRVEPYVWSAEHGAEPLHIRVSAEGHDLNRIEINHFDGNRLTVAVSDRGQSETFLLAPKASISLGDRDADSARLAGSWRLAQIGETHLSEAVSIFYEFAPGGSFQSHIEGAAAVHEMGALTHGLWYLSASRAFMYDMLTDERYDGRLLVLASDEARPTPFTVVQLDDHSLELRGDSLLGLPTLRFVR